MLVLFDTEFTDLSNPSLLSVGLVTFEGDLECYAELSLDHEMGRQRAKRSTEFVHDAVLIQWGLIPNCHEVTEAAMGRRVTHWLESLHAVSGEPINMAFDYEADAELLVRIFRASGTWDKLQPIVRLVNIGQLSAAGEFINAQEDFFESLSKNGPRRHHALADARAMKAGFIAAKDVAIKMALAGRSS